MPAPGWRLLVWRGGIRSEQALGVDVDEPTANTPKSKPAPQTLEPALVESQSIFMSVTVKVEPPGFPELPDFLRRTPEPEATR